VSIRPSSIGSERDSKRPRIRPASLHAGITMEARLGIRTIVAYVLQTDNAHHSWYKSNARFTPTRLVRNRVTKTLRSLLSVLSHKVALRRLAGCECWKK